MTTTEGRYVDYIPLLDVQLAPRNPKGHDHTAIARSIGHFGFAELPLLDERTGRLVAGHGRHEQLVALHASGATPPDGVQVGEDGAWLMPVVRGWASRSDEDAEAYLVASNQIGVLGGWDERLLAELLGDLADSQLLELTGFDADSLDDLLTSIQEADVPPPVALTDPDDEPEPPVEPRSRHGDVWLLGPHRVLCGDSTDLAAVEGMLEGDRPAVMWTDPPYGVQYEGKTADALTIRNDSAAGLPALLAGAFATAVAVLRPGAPFYVAHADTLRSVFEQAVRDAGLMFRQNLIWVKDTLVLGRSDYHYRHEPILYGFTPGGTGRLGRGGPAWFGDDAQTTVFEVPKPSRSEDHPTKKPVELIRRQLTNSCRPGDGPVLDLFGGSGSTLIATHHHGGEARVVELDPRFVDVICRRYQEHTGTLPVLRSTGEEVDFAAERANP